MPCIEPIPLIPDSETMVVDLEILLPMIVSDKVVLADSDNKEIQEASEMEIPEDSEILNLVVDSVIRLLNQDLAIIIRNSHNRDTTMVVSEVIQVAASDLEAEASIQEAEASEVEVLQAAEAA